MAPLVRSVIESVRTGNEDVPVGLEERKTEELVIGLVGAVGSGVSTTAARITEIITSKFGYECKTIKLSDIINGNIHKVGRPPVDATDNVRIEKLQEAGNLLRKKFGLGILAEYAIELIHEARGDPDLAESKRVCWIIDSLKNPEEAIALRDVYSSCFWVTAVFATETERLRRLEALGLELAYIQKVKKADLDEGIDYGQSVREVLVHADMFIRNDQNNKSALDAPVKRFVDLIFGYGIITPTIHETAMAAADAQAKRSACMSRQVGASIISKDGETIGLGCNDVPRFGGGLYPDQVENTDHRCFRWGEEICHNDKYKNAIYAQILDFSDSGSRDKLKRLLASTDIKTLIEFSRAIHAEMEAILSVARSGRQGLYGSSLYTTTFPCHNCARHIVAAGIEVVFYIEAYPKSKALTLHHDAITTDENDNSKVRFLQYEGASPKGFRRLFEVTAARKVDGRLKIDDAKTMKPVWSPPMDGLAQREQIALARFKQLEEEASR